MYWLLIQKSVDGLSKRVQRADQKCEDYWSYWLLIQKSVDGLLKRV